MRNDVSRTCSPGRCWPGSGWGRSAISGMWNGKKGASARGLGSQAMGFNIRDLDDLVQYPHFKNMECEWNIMIKSNGYIKGIMRYQPDYGISTYDRMGLDEISWKCNQHYGEVNQDKLW